MSGVLVMDQHGEIKTHGIGHICWFIKQYSELLIDLPLV